MIRYAHIDSPVGPLQLVVSDDGLRSIEFHNAKHQLRHGADWQRGEHPLIDLTATQLDEYFAGSRKQFDIPLAPQGTEFQRQVWLTLASIPYGSTWTYADMATQIGKPTATRAVGAANGRNPIAIVLPCHRVIGKDGSLTGFSGGLPVKQFLLELEGVLPVEKALFG